MLPVYHAMNALLANSFGVSNVDAFIFSCLLLSLVWVGYCYLRVLFDSEFPVLIKTFFFEYLGKFWLFLFVILSFALFIIANTGVVVGDSSQHLISFNISNFYFYLLVSFFLFLHFNIFCLNHISSLLKSNKWVIVLLIILFIIYLFTYEHPHKYNFKELSFYRHNLILYYSCNIFLRVLSYFAMAWMILSIIVSVKNSKSNIPLLLLLPFSFQSIVPLISNVRRYYLISLSLFIGLRSAISANLRLITLIFYLSETGYVLYHISHNYFCL
jgi:alpha-1,2-glucosyltransferase